MMDQETQYRDELSGIYNRRYLSEVLSPRIEKQIERGDGFCLVMVDIDHFKEINDIYGHPHGDQVIRDFSAFLQNCIRPSDTVIRYGGDEFLCLMQDIGRDDAERIYQRILEKCRFHRLGGHTVTISVGLAEYPGDGRSLEDLIKMADDALYDAKRRGRDRIGNSGEKQLEIPLRAFVDRSREKEILSLGLAAAEDRARAMVVSGSVGIGKTRLVKEVLNRVSYREVLWADCLDIEEGLSYYVIRQLLAYKLKRRGQQILSQLPPAFQLEIAKLMPEVAPQVSREAGALGYTLDRYRLYEGVRRVLEIGDNRKIMVLDNIQWMDRDSLGVLRYLMRAMRQDDIAFVLISRREEAGGEWDAFWADVGRELELVRLELGHLDTQAIKEFVSLALGEEPPQSLLSFIVRKSGGNPYFIEEIIKELDGSGHLWLKSGRWTFREPEEPLVPQKVADVVHNKYNRLSPEARKLLTAASVIGSFDRRLLERLLGFNPGHIDGLLDEVVRLGLAVRDGLQIKFKEEISQQAIYRNWAAAEEVARWHAKAAEILAARQSEEGPGDVEQLAWHYRQSGQHDPGIDYCLRAAELSEQRYSDGEARRYLRWALDLMEKAGVPLRSQRYWDVRMKLLEISFRVGDPNKLLEEYQRLLQEAREQRDRDREAQIHFRLATILAYSFCQHKRALPHIRRSLELFHRLGKKPAMAGALNLMGTVYRYLGQYRRSNSALRKSLSLKCGAGPRAQTWVNLGNLHFSQGRVEEARNYFLKALRLFVRRNDRLNQALVLGNLSVAARILGQTDKAMELIQQALNIKRLVGDRKGEAISLISLGNVYAEQDKYAKALECFQSAQAINAEVPQRGLDLMIARNTGLLHLSLSSYNKALRSMEQALSLAEESGDRESRQIALNSLGDIHLCQGELEKARDFLQKARAGYLSPNPQTRFMLSASKLYYYLESDQLQKARKEVRKIYSLSRIVKSKSMASIYRQIAAELWLKQGRPKEAQRELIRIPRIMGQGYSSHLGYYHLLWGRAEQLRGSWDVAQRHLRLARDIFRSLGMRMQEGQSLYWLGLASLKNGEGDGGRSFLSEAQKIFEDIGARLWQQRAEAQMGMGKR